MMWFTHHGPVAEMLLSLAAPNSTAAGRRARPGTTSAQAPIPSVSLKHRGLSVNFSCTREQIDQNEQNYGVLIGQFPGAFSPAALIDLD
ncbi:beta-catenin-interacting protein 1 isoform X1 [Pogoniulus pusillus]|uniref:beta-catenin-interacting protein 1 isoform X1 n=1 Tax=Pogoniulus pusillus TaxID=488313 RepID=UPI0030B929CF